MADDFHMGEKQAARVMGVSAKTLARWRKAARIGFHITPGGRVFYTADQLAACRAGMRRDPQMSS